MKYIYFTFLCGFMSIASFAQDPDISLSSSYVVFENSSNAPSATITLTNKRDSDMDIGTLSLTGSHSTDFNITNDKCSSATLKKDNSCNVELAFVPKNHGIKNALLHIPYDSKSIDVFLTNNEGAEHNVQRRLAPIIYDINISEELDANTSYTFKWSLIGYHHGYKTKIVLFDCTGMAIDRCASSDSNNEKFLESSFRYQSSEEAVNWTYQNQEAKKFNYSYTVTMPEKRANGDNWDSNGTKIAIRFYVISTDDENNHKSSLSLLVPGNISGKYYDTSGRKIEKKGCPTNGCNQ